MKDSKAQPQVFKLVVWLWGTLDWLLGDQCLLMSHILNCLNVHSPMGDGLFNPVQLWRDKRKFLETFLKHVTKVTNNSSRTRQFWHTSVK
jgi:hypothetical protein